jgi:dienelactone hydrolase
VAGFAVLIVWFSLWAYGWAGPANTASEYSPTTGTLAVDSVLYDWHDPTRDREIPVKIYYPKTGDGPFPVIIFSHGLGGSREGYEYLGRCWASHGYVSVHVQHVGSDTAVWRDSFFAMRAMRQAAARPANALNRPKDISFAIEKMQRMNTEGPVLKNRLDLERIGVGGHSFGAYTVLAIAGEVFGGPLIGKRTFADPRVKAAMPMSAPVPRNRSRFADAFSEIKIPCFHMTGTRDDSPIGDTKAADRRVPFDFCNSSDQYLVTFRDGDHMIFSGRGRLGGGAQKDALFQGLICAASAAFWDAYLKDDSRAKTWLSEGGFENVLGINGTLEKKLQTHPQ